MTSCPASHCLLSLLAVLLCRHVCGGWGKMGDRSDTQNPPPCPLACTCSFSTFPSFAKPLFTVRCRDMEPASWSVPACNATQALLLSHSHLSNLSSLPPFTHLRLLDLSFNYITCSHCRQGFQHMGILVRLNLSGNAMQTLQDDTFSGLDSLEELDLSYNRLSVIQPHAFRGLRQLSVLHLGHNQLYDLERSWLMSLTSLHELYLQGNHISDIDGYTFSHSSLLLQLDLSNNALRTVSDYGFLGLQRLKMLNLSNNELVTIPSHELQRLTGLVILLLDGIQAPVVQSGDFSQLNVSSISLSFLPHLSMVSKGAFSNLTQLRTLQMHDNYQLMYIHPQAFDHVPLLHRLALHNNQLVTLSSGIRDSLPSLDELHLYHNPLHCDCNIFWLRQDMVAMDDSVNGSVDTYLRHWDKLMCSSPDARSQTNLKHVALHLLSPSCSPTSLPFFSDTYHVTVGDVVSLQCQAVGVPQPILSWILPHGHIVNSSTDSWHLISPDNTAITIPGVRLQDQGTYSCRADNGLGYDTSSTLVYVHNKDLRLSLSTLPNSAITVSWVGSVPQQQMWQYHLQYRQNGVDNTSHRVDLHSGVHNCTLTGLLPLTSYKVCLVFRDVFTVHCLNITTSQHVLFARPSSTVSTVSSAVVSVCAVVVLMVLLYAVRLVRRRRRRRRRQKKDYSDSLTEDKEMEKILLEPIDQRTPDSPQCTPRTSLLPRSYV